MSGSQDTIDLMRELRTLRADNKLISPLASTLGERVIDLHQQEAHIHALEARQAFHLNQIDGLTRDKRALEIQLEMARAGGTF